MATERTTSQSFKSITGAALLALGFVILFGNLDGIAGQLGNLSGRSDVEALGVFPSLVLTVSHALQAYAFDHAGFLSGLLQILLSFWPLILIILGTVLLRDAFWGRFASYKAGAGSSAMGDR